MSLYVRFERGRDDVIGPTLGPFKWVQQTYQDLRVAPDGETVAPDGETVAQWFEKAGEWFIVRGEHADEFYSDFVVFSVEGEVHLTQGHDCVAGRLTIANDGVTEERWDDESGWTPTGRRWDSGKGEWR